MPLTHNRGRLLLFNDSRNWTDNPLFRIKMLYQWAISTYCIVLPQLLHFLLGNIIQHVTFLSPRGLLRHSSRPMCHLSDPQTVGIAFKPSVAKPRTKTLLFLVPTNWLVRSEVSTTCYSPTTDVPCKQAFKPSFFPLHQCPRYLHPFYRWRPPHGVEQACIDEPFRGAGV